MMKFESLFTKKTALIIATLCFLGMVIGTYFDYQISETLYNRNSWFGKILAGYGQYPTAIGMSFCGTLIIYVTKRRISLKTILSYLGGVVLLVNGVFMAIFDPLQYIEELPMILNVLIVILVIGGTNFYLIKFVKGKERHEIIRFIKFALFVIVGQLILINVIKMAWGRPRMRMIVDTKDATFQPWYIMGRAMKDKLVALGVANEEFKSFPSGHVACAVTAVVFSTIPLIAGQKRPGSKILFISGFIFALIVAYSRIIVGAHFLTDVTMGLAIGCFIAFEGYYIFYERKK